MPDPGWLEAYDELHDLHCEKSATYGTEGDALANYTRTAARLGEPPEFVVMIRMFEKLERARNLIKAGRAVDVDEWPDLAALALAGEALRRRRV